MYKAWNLQLPAEILATSLGATVKFGFRTQFFPHHSAVSMFFRYVDHDQNIDRQH